jgi:glycosyltransferase involved in cell wall biosynthesis
MPVYRGEAFLREAIESVLSQSFGDFELLVIDDCSADRTAEIVREYARADTRVSFEVNATNSGMVENWNRCLRKARGCYIKYVFQDDILTNADSLGTMVGVLDSRREVSLVASARLLIDAASKPIRTDSFFRFGASAPGRDMIRYCLLKHGNVIGEPSAVLFRREHAGRGFNPGYRQIVDLEMWFHLLEQGDFVYLTEPLCGFRVHACQQTAKNVSSLVHIEDFELLMAEYLRRDYLNMRPLARGHIRYYQFYNLWRLSRRNLYNRRLALEKITRYYGLFQFFTLLPFHKAYDPVFKYLRSRLRRRILRVER